VVPAIGAAVCKFAPQHARVDAASFYSQYCHLQYYIAGTVLRSYVLTLSLTAKAGMAIIPGIISHFTNLLLAILVVF
jgi:hypothetical protein